MSGSDERGCLWVTLFVVLCAYWGADVWYSRWAYELYYGLDSNHLSIDKKPHDCDFWKAPIGAKECHYKRIVSTVEIGKGAKTNRPMMSFDGGKTWSYFTPDPGTTVAQGPTVTSASITWEKVED